MPQIHGTCVEIAGLAVLFRGPPNSGKSDLALRMIDGGARLVADDRVDLRVDAGRLYASAPAALAGRLEIRGLGIMRVASVAEAPLALVCDLVAPGLVERLPEAETTVVETIAVPRLTIAPFEPSAAAKVRAAVRTLRRGILLADHDL